MRVFVPKVAEAVPFQRHRVPALSRPTRSGRPSPVRSPGTARALTLIPPAVRTRGPKAPLPLPDISKVPVRGVRCVELQGGGGRRRGASATDDNAADRRARPRVCGMIRRTGPPAQGGRGLVGDDEL